MEKGYIHVYTGNGKGKSTAAFGLAVRAVGAGLKVIIIHFLKGQEYSEHSSFRKLGIDYEFYGTKEFIVGEPSEEVRELARNGLKRALKAFEEGYDVVILDEVNVSVYMKVLTVEEVMKVIKAKPDDVELILTGRYAPDEFIEIADLVTEMKEVKHYYQKGIQARRGIEM